MEADRLCQTLNSDQRTALLSIVKSIQDKDSKTFFIDGYGGTGKKYLYQTLCHILHANHNIIICVASTGLVCLLLPGGQTGHSMFKIPIENLDADSICNITKESQHGQLMKIIIAVVYDECLMTHRHSFEALDRTSQDLCDNCKHFGGLTMIFGGDFSNKYFLSFPMVQELISSILPFGSHIFGTTWKFSNFERTCAFENLLKTMISRNGFSMLVMVAIVTRTVTSTFLRRWLLIVKMI